MNKYIKILSLTLSLIALPIINAADRPKPEVVLTSSLPENSPAYMLVCYLKALQIPDYKLARTFASDHKVSNSEWSYATHPGTRESFFNNLVLSEIRILNEIISSDGKSCEIEIDIREKRDNGKAGWQQTRGWLLRIDEKWLVVHYAEFSEGQLSDPVLIKRLYNSLNKN